MHLTVALKILLNKAGDKEDSLEDGVEGTLFIFCILNCLDLLLENIKVSSFCLIFDRWY